MGSVTRFAAINTKLKGRRRSLLKEEEYNKLVSFCSIKQIYEYLKTHHGYDQIFQQVKSSDIHRGQLEVLLNQNIVRQIETIGAYFSGDYKKFFQSMFMQFEIEDLKLIIRSIMRGENLAEIKDSFIHSRRYTSLDYEKLLSARDIDEFIEKLKGSVYYEELKTLTREDAVKREFHMEMKLEILYLRTMMEKAKKLSKQDYNAVTDIVGTDIDLSNIQWIYRAKKYYNLFPEEILIYSLPFGKKIKYSNIKGLCYTKDLAEFKDKSSKLGYQFIFEQDKSLIERDCKRYLYKVLARKSLETQMDIGDCIVYIYLLQIEMKDLISIIESIRYGYDMDKMKQYLIRTV